MLSIHSQGYPGYQDDESNYGYQQNASIIHHRALPDNFNTRLRLISSLIQHLSIQNKKKNKEILKITITTSLAVKNIQMAIKGICFRAILSHSLWHIAHLWTIDYSGLEITIGFSVVLLRLSLKKALKRPSKGQEIRG